MFASTCALIATLFEQSMFGLRCFVCGQLFGGLSICRCLLITCFGRCRWFTTSMFASMCRTCRNNACTIRTWLHHTSPITNKHVIDSSVHRLKIWVALGWKNPCLTKLVPRPRLGAVAVVAEEPWSALGRCVGRTARFLKAAEDKDCWGQRTCCAIGLDEIGRAQCEWVVEWVRGRLANGRAQRAQRVRQSGMCGMV